MNLQRKTVKPVSLGRHRRNVPYMLIAEYEDGWEFVELSFALWYQD